MKPDEVIDSDEEKPKEPEGDHDSDEGLDEQ
jgi:hypothetical protein